MITLEEKRSAMLCLYCAARNELDESEWWRACVYLSIIGKRFIYEAIGDLTVFQSVQGTTPRGHTYLVDMAGNAIDVQESRFYIPDRTPQSELQESFLNKSDRPYWEFLENGWLHTPRRAPAERARRILERAHADVAALNLQAAGRTPAQLHEQRTGRRLLGVSKSGTAWYSVE